MTRKFVYLAIFYALMTIAGAHAAPKQCNPEKSKPCGQSCIRKEYTCRKDATTAVTAPPSLPKAKK